MLYSSIMWIMKALASPELQAATQIRSRIAVVHLLPFRQILPHLHEVVLFLVDGLEHRPELA